MSKRVALIQGGMGAESKVSEATGAAFASALDQLGFGYAVFNADKHLPENLLQYKPDVALLAVHGKFAEDGTVQGICEYLKIPYTGSGVLTSALCMDKTLTKEYLAFHKVPTPEHQIFNAEEMKITEFKLTLPLPVVVKPSREGSSVGISIVKKSDGLEGALKEAAQYDRYVLIEEFIEGAELTVPILDGKALTPIEIEPKTDFYNYENKYTEGKTEYHLPPRLENEVVNKAKDIAMQVYHLCRLRGYGRVDFRVTKDGRPLLMEVNTLPGCTPTSLFPKAAAHEGIAFKDLIVKLIERAGLDYEGLI